MGWLTDQLLQVIHQVECGKAWPQQAIEGFIISLEKIPGASTVNGFRPITLFSLIFRTWGSIRSRECLRHLKPWIHATCAGNVPGRSTSSIWYGILQQIEEAQRWGFHTCGGVLDLVKAFDHLPRELILYLMVRLSIPWQVVGAWGRAAASMSRRFKIRQAVGPALKSCTGLAEGDAMSVVGMLVLNVLAHTWMAHRYPRVVTWSYVDNLELTGDNADDVADAMRGMDAFCSLCDILIDANKSYTWSVDAECERPGRTHTVLASAHQLYGDCPM